MGFIIGNILVISNLAFPKAKKEKEGDLVVGVKKRGGFIKDNKYQFKCAITSWKCKRIFKSRALKLSKITLF
ncbi:MAG: hypothetical protein CMO38_04555 [Verrucomicrobiaceae bacterium]|nr:hypothetical protein [Verrucomicrobiaceae bacterium]